MSRVVAIGAGTLLAGYALAGVEVVDAPDPERVRRAWDEIADDVSLVLLTHDARRALPDPIVRREPLWTVLPA